MADIFPAWHDGPEERTGWKKEREPILTRRPHKHAQRNGGGLDDVAMNGRGKRKSQSHHSNAKELVKSCELSVVISTDRRFCFVF